MKDVTVVFDPDTFKHCEDFYAIEVQTAIQRYFAKLTWKELAICLWDGNPVVISELLNDDACILIDIQEVDFDSNLIRLGNLSRAK